MKTIRSCAIAAFLLLAACAADDESVVQDDSLKAPADPGALIGLTMTSTVGTLLDEVPAAMRTRVATTLLAKPASYWQDRAKAQVALATYRLVFRNFYYGGGTSKMQLPLPPASLWKVTLQGAPRRTTVGTHDLVVVNYKFESTLLTTFDSPKISEPKLAMTGGVWEEPFIFPLDPELLLQRTGYACMDEEDFPFNSVDSEEVDSFYDQDCDVERELTSTACHQTQMPDRSCLQAVDDFVGRVETKLRFERLAWNATLADQVRVGPVTSTTGADLQVVEEHFRINRVNYRYFPPNDCALVEQCVGAPGWRRVLEFSTTDKNVGSKTLHIGDVDYYMTGGATTNGDHGVFEFSSCHNHFHFMHYGTFSYGQDEETTAKRGFCLQSTNRFSNLEISPLHHPFGGCDFQGVEVGWVDEYKAGLPCQWVDVTNVDTSAGPVTRPLSFVSNPDGFLCEGTPITDDKGNQLWEPTTFTTASGTPVDRPLCDFSANYFANNTHTYDATLPVDGQGFINTTCTRGQIGQLRNCGFTLRTSYVSCAPGEEVSLRCTLPAGSQPQVARFCETSAALGVPIPCRWEDDVLSATIDPAGTNVTFTCPASRGLGEPGGAYSLYTAPVFPEDAAKRVTCTPL